MKKLNIVLVLVAVVLAATIVGLLLTWKQHDAPQIAAEPPTPTVAPPPPAPPTPTPAERILTAHTLKGAMKVAQPLMSDETNTDSPGAALLTIWAVDAMKWADVAVATDETTFALVLKDSDEARGKRLCTSGQIIQITAHKDAGKYYEGLLTNGSDHIFRYFAVGSSGSLVGESWARICGVVVGKFDYSNSMGGVGHAVALVGMFDLPENRARK